MAKIDKCYQVKDGDDWLLIPNCWGALEHPDLCTCDIEGSELEKAQSERDIAKRHIARMIERSDDREQRMNQMFKRNKALRARITELEAQSK